MSILELQNAITTCSAAKILVCFGDGHGIDMLKHFDVNTDSWESIERSINKKITELNLILAEDSAKDKNQTINYSNFIQSIGIHLPYQLNPRETTLEEFVSVYNNLLNKAKAEKAVADKHKSR